MGTKKIAWIAVASIFLVLIIWVISANEVQDATQIESTEQIEKEPSYYLTLPSDTLRFEQHQVKSGESFGALLGKRGISTKQIYQIAAAEDNFNVRRIRAWVEVQFVTVIVHCFQRILFIQQI